MDKNVNRGDFMKVVSSLVKNNLQDGKTYKIAGCFNVTGWRDGIYFTKDNFERLKEDVIYNFSKQYENADTEQLLKHFVIYEANTPKATGGNDPKNDCFFSSLIQGVNYNYDLLPSEISSQVKLKQFLQIGRESKVELENVNELIPILAKNDISIQIEGDYTLNTEEKQVNIKIILEDEHYSLKYENMTYIETMRDQMIKGIDKSKYDRQICSYYEDLINHKLYKYDGKTIVEYSNTPKIRFSHLYNFKDLMVKAESKTPKDMKAIRDYYVEQQRLLYRKTNGTVNLLRYRNVKCCAIDTFLNFFQKFNIEVDPINELEGRWLYEFYHFQGGGFVYHENGYEGEFITIDENSAYPSTYISTMFTPIKKPVFKTLKQSELKTYVENGKTCTSFTYGLYRCRVSYDETKKKLFKWKFRHDKYSHMELRRAQELGLTVTLIEDNEVNAMLYEKESLFKSDVMFGEFVQYFMNLKKDGLLIAKEFINSFSGALAQQNKRRKLATPKRKQYVDDFDSVIPSHTDGNFIIDSLDMDKIFKYCFARQTVFAVNKFRVRLSELCEPVNDDILRICTDSITLKNHNEDSVKTKFRIGNTLKTFKVEMEGKCKIENSRITYWHDEENKYCTKKELKELEKLGKKGLKKI
jgi:hypothetical protein